jgi:phospholipid-binding lipoprotein MlaA
MMLRAMLAAALAAVVLYAVPVSADDSAPAASASAATAPAAVAPAAAPPAAAAPAPGAPDQKGPPPGMENQQVYSDPLAPFNEAMFTFNLKLDDWVLRPVATGYSYIAPQPVRVSVGNFFDNVGVIPRFANSLFQLHFKDAGSELGRFAINTTVGVAGFFDPADKWFGLKEHKNDFGLTLRYYNVKTGPYLMLPFFGPSTIGDTVGRVADGFMNPMYYFGLPWYIPFAASAGQDTMTAINYRSLHLNQFEEADRYAVDLYGAVQDAYLQTREHDVKKLKQE